MKYFKKNNKYGIKDKNGNIILKPTYDRIWINWTDEGYIEVELNNKLGLFGAQGNSILEPLYDYIWLGWVDKGYIIVKLKNKFGLFDKKGNQLLPFIYDKEINLVKLYKRLKLKEDLLK